MPILTSHTASVAYSFHAGFLPVSSLKKQLLQKSNRSIWNEPIQLPIICLTGISLDIHSLYPHIFMFPKSPTLRNSSWKRCRMLSKRPSVQRRVKLRLLAEDRVAVRARRRKGVVRSGGLAGAGLHLKAYKQTSKGMFR